MAREIVASGWKPVEKNTLQGFCTLTLPSGLVIHHCMLHVKGNSRWIAFPAREWIDTTGRKQFAVLLDFTTRDIKERFQREALAAVDRLLQGEGRHDDPLV